MTTQRFRLRYTFWLDLHKEDERQIADQVTILKDNRTFAKTVRDGIRLIVDLQAGKVGVLLELFPFVRTMLATAQSSVIVQQTDQQWLLEQIEQLFHQSSSQAVLAIDTPRVTARDVTASGGAGPKALNVPKFDLPIFDDDDDDLDTLIVHKDSTTNSTQNFLNSLMNLQQ